MVSFEQLNNKIKEQIPQIIELFVEVYGEGYRDRIASRLNNTEFVFAGIKEPSSNEDFLLNSEYRASAKDYLSKSDIILAKETYDKMLKDALLGGGVTSGGAFVSAKKDDLKNISSVCLLGYFDELSDCVLFHELNHIVSSDIYQNASGFTSRSGLLRSSYVVDDNGNWKMAETEKEQEDVETFESINEVFNDYLSLKVLKLAEAKGIKLGKAENAEATYAAAYPMLSGFIEDNMNMIVKAMLEGKTKDLNSYAGKENFIKLARATDELIVFEGEHADEIFKRMKYYEFDIQKLLTERLENIPINLRSYASMGKKICEIVDDIYAEHDNELE